MASSRDVSLLCHLRKSPCRSRRSSFITAKSERKPVDVRCLSKPTYLVLSALHEFSSLATLKWCANTGKSISTALKVWTLLDTHLIVKIAALQAEHPRPFLPVISLGFSLSPRSPLMEPPVHWQVVLYIPTRPCGLV